MLRRLRVTENWLNLLGPGAVPSASPGPAPSFLPAGLADLCCFCPLQGPPFSRTTGRASERLVAVASSRGWGGTRGPLSIAGLGWPHADAAGGLGGEAQTWPSLSQGGRRDGLSRFEGTVLLLFIFAGRGRGRGRIAKEGEEKDEELAAGGGAWIPQLLLSFLPSERWGNWILFPAQP